MDKQPSWIPMHIPTSPRPRPQLPPRVIMLDPSGSMGPWEDVLKEVVVEVLSEHTRRSVALFLPHQEPVKTDGALLEAVVADPDFLLPGGRPEPSFRRLLASEEYGNWVSSQPVLAAMEYIYVTDDESALNEIVGWPNSAEWPPGATVTIVILDEASRGLTMSRSNPLLPLIKSGCVRFVGCLEFLQESRARSRAWGLEEVLQAIPEPKDGRVRPRM